MFLLFSYSFKLISGNISIYVIPSVAFHTSAGLVSANQSGSGTHRS